MVPLELAANLYHRMLNESEDSELGLEEFCSNLVSIRYPFMGPTHSQGKILMFLLMDKEVLSISHLVVLILVIEAGFAENLTNVQIEFVEVIVAELSSKNVPQVLATGKADPQNPVGMLRSFQPTIEKALLQMRQ